MSVCLSVCLLVRGSIAHFFKLSKTKGKWSRTTLYMSAISLLKSFTINLSFNITFPIFLSKYFSHNLSYFHKLSLTTFFTIFLMQCFFHNQSFTIFLSKFLFHNLCFTIFLSRSFSHNLFHYLYIQPNFFNLFKMSEASLSGCGLVSV